MKIHFSIEYKTQWGEEIRVQLSLIANNGKSHSSEIALTTTDGTLWEKELDTASDNFDRAEYRYAMYSDGKLVWTEWELAPHIIYFTNAANHYIADDLWRSIPENLPLFSSAYSDSIAPHKADSPLSYFNQTLQLRVLEPRLRADEHLAVTGNIPQLGNWQTPVRLTPVALQEWAINIDASLIYYPVEYKYVIVDNDNNIIQWEDGTNRLIKSIHLMDKQIWQKADMQPSFNISKWKCAGVVMPVFSLRSENSYGIGDFGDLKNFTVWAAKAGMHAVQILPINDTTMDGSWMDSYPYNAISIYALNPIYCDLTAVGRLDDRLKMEKFMIWQQEINHLPQMDYEQVFKLKNEYLKLIYEQNGEKVLATTGFKKFFSANSEWLVPYAAFCYLRDKHKTPVFWEWKEHSVYNKKEIDKLTAKKSESYKDIAFHYYIQYQLHLQMLDVRNTAHEHGVVIKGDIPIGISLTSVEAWTEPHYFNLNSQAGAPPDDFSANGQNWGFPTYNWEVMEADGCSWWVKRFKKMADYFDAFRIDHVLGFFRIWDIPSHSVHGLLGQFSPSLPMTVREIESYGVHFDPELMTRPYITEEMLKDIFDYKVEMIKLLYLDKREDGRYNLKPEFDTQRKIQAAFWHKTDEDNCNVRDGLYSLVSEVLFIADRLNPTMYHPRISAYNSFIYKSLTESERKFFDHLYDDYYYHRHNQFWYDEAMKKLPMLTQATRMLVCAEDLGMVPECVAWVMEQLRILSLEIQTMPKAFGIEFGKLQNNPYRSVSTISTHDMPTMRQWWEEDQQRAQRFYNNALYKDGKAPETLPGWLCEEIVNQHLFSPSMLCLLSLQDWLSIDENLRNPDTMSERINIPANPRHYWRWRMHMTIEQLMQADEYNTKVRELIERANRK